MVNCTPTAATATHNPFEIVECLSTPREYQNCAAPALIEVTHQELQRYFSLTSTDEKMLFIMGHRKFLDQTDIAVKVAPTECAAQLQAQVTQYRADTTHVMDAVNVDVDRVAKASKILFDITTRIERSLGHKLGYTVPSHEYEDAVQWRSQQYTAAKKALGESEAAQHTLAAHFPKLASQFQARDQTVETPWCDWGKWGERCYGSYPDSLYERYSAATRNIWQDALYDSWFIACDTKGLFDGCPWSDDVTTFPPLVTSK